MRREMEAYCESDVKLLKAGCQKFRQEFQQKANFDPLEKCVTIASACNRFWRKKMVPLKTIASQPPRDWHGSRSNQSIKALKWLAWQEHQLRLQQPAPSDRIRSIRNMGEQRVANHLVDGYDPTTQTVYEFHGCLWHGCPDCFPVQRNRYPSNSFSTRLKSLNRLNPDTPSSVDAPTPSNFITRLSPESRSNTSTSRPCTPGSTRHKSIR